ncbi:hypothetical protein [Paenibacillus sp. GCM10027626]|uniref:hypothetical protein n=1 Tax=Paenibacillus sp. GCM10027626 TaxID=3273411 RepID=UPI003627ADD8
MASDSLIGDAADTLVYEPGASWSGTPGMTVRLEPGDNLEAWIGAMSLCLMNGLDLERASSFCKGRPGTRRLLQNVQQFRENP